jgi:hypothetical protein
MAGQLFQDGFGRVKLFVRLGKVANFQAGSRL